MVNQVVYEMGLRDNLSSGIQTATGHVNRLESALKSAGGMVAGLAAGFAIFKGFEFIGQATETFEKLHQAEAQLENTLKNTGDRAGMTSDQMIDFAKETQHNIKATTADVVSLENVFARFGNLSSDTFKKAVLLSTDMATSLKTDGEHVAKTLARVLDNPIQSARILRQLQVTLTKGEKDHLAALKDSASQQQYIFDLLAQRGYAGAAAAAAAADPMFELNKTLQETKETLGDAATNLIKELTPALVKFLQIVKEASIWLKEHWQLIKNIAVALGVAWAAFKIIAGAQAIIATITLAMEGMAAGSAAAALGMEGLGTAATVAMGPIGLLAAAIGGLVFLYSQLADAQADVEKAFSDNRTAAHKEAIEDMQRLVGYGYKDGKRKGEPGSAIFAGGKSMYGKMTNDQMDLKVAQQIFDENIDKKLDEVYKTMHDASNSDKTIDKAKMQQDKLLAEKFEVLSMTDKDIPGLIPKPKAKTIAERDLAAPKAEKTKATGSKSVTINVTIQKLGETHINTTNIKEGMIKLKDHVVAALTGAVNDFQIVANNS